MKFLRLNSAVSTPDGDAIHPVLLQASEITLVEAVNPEWDDVPTDKSQSRLRITGRKHALYVVESLDQIHSMLEYTTGESIVGAGSGPAVTLLCPGRAGL